MVPRVSDDAPLQPPAIRRLRSDKSTKSTHSYSSASAYEAGDERSSSEFERMDSDNAATHQRVRPEYDGEDTRLTSKKELAGWYAYGWAAEVFVICGMGTSSQSQFHATLQIAACLGSLLRAVWSNGRSFSGHAQSHTDTQKKIENGQETDASRILYSHNIRTIGTR